MTGLQVGPNFSRTSTYSILGLSCRYKVRYGRYHLHTCKKLLPAFWSTVAQVAVSWRVAECCVAYNLYTLLGLLIGSYPKTSIQSHTCIASVKVDQVVKTRSFKKHNFCWWGYPLLPSSSSPKRQMLAPSSTGRSQNRYRNRVSIVFHTHSHPLPLPGRILFLRRRGSRRRQLVGCPEPHRSPRSTPLSSLAPHPA